MVLFSFLKHPLRGVVSCRAANACRTKIVFASARTRYKPNFHGTAFESGVCQQGASSAVRGDSAAAPGGERQGTGNRRQGRYPIVKKTPGGSLAGQAPTRRCDLRSMPIARGITSVMPRCAGFRFLATIEAFFCAK